MGKIELLIIILFSCFIGFNFGKQSKTYFKLADIAEVSDLERSLKWQNEKYPNSMPPDKQRKILQIYKNKGVAFYLGEK
jgi:hypothetical protein